jgi:hypothetical protein
MSLDMRLRRLLSRPPVFAVLFFSIPLLLAYSYPSSFWANTDYEPLGLADALNVAYRIADHQMYPAAGISYHPGVPFYLMSWLALALTGYPVASESPGYFDAVIEHVEDYHQIAIWVGALVGATGVYLFARAARNLVPVGVVATGLLVWLASTPATLLTFTSPSIDSFAILINSLFFVVLIRLAYDRDIAPSAVIFSACVGALAYLNKLSYIYIPFALAFTIILKLGLYRIGWIRASQLFILGVFSFLAVTIAVGFFIIGWDGFRDVLRYHQSVFYGSELYGTGDQVVVSRDEIWRAVAAIPADRTYAILIALVGGAGLVVGGLVTGLRKPEHASVAVISIATGIASILSAIIVMKHYAVHYTAGVSATLPSCLVTGYLLAKSWDYRLRIVGTALAAIAILFMANQARESLIYVLASRANSSQLATADLQEIHARLAGSKRTVEFAYKTPFSWYGEGFVITFASVPRLTDAFLQSRADAISSMTAGLANRDVGAYVIDKGYFPTVESIKAAPNVALLGPKPVTFKDGDELIELRTVFLLIPN